MMNIVFLGKSSDDKQFFLLCLAKILMQDKKVAIHSRCNYAFENSISDEVDFCGVNIQHFSNSIKLASKLEGDRYNLIDLDQFTEPDFDCKAVLVCEPLRKHLEASVELAGQYSRAKPSMDIMVIYLNLMEFSKVDKKYLDLYLERNIPGITKISGSVPIYFEESNRVAMLESQFSERLDLRALTPAYKKQVLTILKLVFDLDIKKGKRLLKMAEKMKG
jgi:hypothetical protein